MNVKYIRNIGRFVKQSISFHRKEELVLTQFYYYLFLLVIEIYSSIITGFYSLDRTAQVLDKVQDIHMAIIRPVPKDTQVTKEDILGEFHFVFLL